MIKKRIVVLIASVLLLAVVAPVTYFAVAPPPRVEAADSLCLIGVAAGIAAAIATLLTNVPSADSGSAAGSWTGSGGSVGDCIWNSIVVPMLRGLIRAFLQKMTQQTINWINGQGNSSGKSFVPNLSVHLQGVGDSVALAFIGQIAAGFQSPFGTSIALSLRSQYLQQSSMAGFFSQYRSTIGQYSPNINAFLAGNWTQGGGVSAWLGLTTQPQNNPYLLYQAASAQLGSNIATAQTNRRQDLMQSGGFLSFCPGNSTSSSGSCMANSNGSCPAGCVADDSASTGCSGTPIAPQAACMSADGTPVQSTTPGSVVMSYLQANVNSGIGQLVSAQDLDAMLMQVVGALANKVLSSTGLFGKSGSGNNSPSGNSPGVGATNANTLAGGVLQNLTDFTTAWKTIQTAATSAKTAVTAAQTACTNSTALTTVTSADMQSAIDTEIQPTLQKAQDALNSITATQTLAQQLQAEASSTNPDTTQMINDVTQLMSMPPSASDVASAQQAASVTGAASASPAGSLKVSGGTTVDQMNLITTNANALASACSGNTTTTNPPPSGTTGTVPPVGGSITGISGQIFINEGTLVNATGLTVAQSWIFITPPANEAACFTVNVDSSAVGKDFVFTGVTQSSAFTGGLWMAWLNQVFGGNSLPGTVNNGTLSQTFSEHYTPQSAGTYYFCIKLSQGGNKLGVYMTY